MSGTLDLYAIVEQQGGWYGMRWNIWDVYRMPQVIGFVIYLISAIAETNRVPFDLPEAETELVAGFHTEYSALEVRALLHGRVRQHVHGLDAGDDALPRRLAGAVRGRRSRGSASSGSCGR